MVIFIIVPEGSQGVFYGYKSNRKVFISMGSTAQSEGRFPRLGEAVPSFEAISHLGPVRLSDYKGRWLVLFSYPADFTPVCTSEVVSFSHLKQPLHDLGCELLGLSTDSLESHLPWLQSIEDWMGEVISFPVIADASHQIAESYGMIMPSLSTTQAARCTFIIDPQQVLRCSFYYPPEVGRDTGEVLRLIKALQFTSRQQVIVPANWQPGHAGIKLPTGTDSSKIRKVATQRLSDN